MRLHIACIGVRWQHGESRAVKCTPSRKNTCNDSNLRCKRYRWGADLVECECSIASGRWQQVWTRISNLEYVQNHDGLTAFAVAQSEPGLTLFGCNISIFS